jgi:hypothetical protein
LLTSAPIVNWRKQRGLATRAQDGILPHKRHWYRIVTVYIWIRIEEGLRREGTNCLEKI